MIGCEPDIPADGDLTELTASSLVDRLESLAELLITCVTAGAALGYRLPLAPARARATFTDLAEEVHSGSVRALIATAGPTIVGFVALVAEQRETEPHLAQLSKLMVHPAFRRQGIALALIAGAELIATAWGRTRLYLFTTDDGIAPACYRRAGYACCGRIPQGGGRADGSLADALIYTKLLQEPPDDHHQLC